jgi:hypothetical protein
MFFCRACAHPLDDVICISEAVAISHGRSGEDDSATGGDGCFFAVDSTVRQIKQVYPIRDMNVPDKEGPLCVVEAVVRKDLSIRRVIRVGKFP